MSSNKKQPPKDKANSFLSKEEFFIDDSRQFDIAILSQKALTTTDLDKFMDELVELISKSLGTEFVKILQLTENKKALKLIKGVGWKEGIVGNTFVEVDYTSQAGYTLINKKPVIVTDFEIENRFSPPPLLVDHKVMSGISMTIMGLEGPFGVLGAHSQYKMNFSVNDVNFFHSAGYVLSSKIIQYESMENIQKEEQKLRILMEYANDAILISDLEGNILDLNAKACSMTQYTKEELLSINVFDLYDQKELQQMPSKTEDIVKSKDVVLERRMVRKDKKVIAVEISLTLLPNGKHIHAIIRDVTERKKTEDLLRNIQKMEAITRVSGGIAHDFNNYLTIINGYAEKILNTKQDELDIEELKVDAFNIKKTTEKSSSLIRNLLSFSSKNHFEIISLDVNQVIIELEKSLISFLGEKITLELDLKAKGYIRTNPDQLQQAIINLVINSKDALEQAKKGKIIIKTYNYDLEKSYENFAFYATPGKFIAISVIDNGSGMSDEVKSHIFEPFYTTKHNKGSGLGLATIYGFINECNGYITVQSSQLEGTTISLFLHESAEEETFLRDKQENILLKKTNKVKKMLIIEDNEELLELIGIFLEKKGFKIVKAINGKQGIETCLKSPDIDLVLTDIVMPEMDGIEMLRNFKEKNINKKIVLMSGYSLENPMTIDYNQETHFIRKPFSMDTLLQLLEKIN